MITFSRLGQLGRFGNQLFQYAGTRLYAELHSIPWYTPDWIGAQIFDDLPLSNGPRLSPLAQAFTPIVQLEDIQSVRRSDRVRSIVGLWGRDTIANLHAHPKEHIDLYGYLQDPYSIQLLHTHRDRIRQWFQFRPDIEQACQKATADRHPWVALHIRRGDLVKRNLTVPVTEYLRVLPEVIGNHTLHVASDDPTARTEFQAFNPFSVQNPIPNLPPFVFDFWMLMHASTLIAGGSTFAWWAAYLGNGTYYAPPLTHLWQKGYAPIIELQHI